MSNDRTPEQSFRFSTDIKVAWGDMDAFGHVNNVLYLRYFESARVEYFKELEYMIEGLANGQTGPIIASLTCNYLRPVVYPDTLRISVRMLPPKTTSVVMEFKMESLAQGGAEVANGNAVVVNYDYAKGAKAPISEELRAKIAKLEGRS